jgi:tRNA1(Val) A37 N6-methylase TrmN6
MKVTNYLLGYKDLYIVQDSDMFNFSLDSVLLPNFVTITKNVKNILDIGCGNAPIPIILSTKCDANITGIEIQPDVYNLAKESLEINSLSDRINLINGDIMEEYKKFPVGSFDLITCNPPFFKYTEESNINLSDYKTIARHEVKLNLSQLMQVAKYLLNNNGTIGIVHRPERIVDIFEEMRKNNIEPKKIQFIYPHENSEANILLVEGKKNGKPGIKILNPIISHTKNGDYTDEIKVFFENN